MSPMRRLWLSIGLMAAVGLLAGSVAVTVGHSRSLRLADNYATMNGSGSGWDAPGRGMMGGRTMIGGNRMGMMGTVWLSGTGTYVASIAAARDRAGAAAAGSGRSGSAARWAAHAGSAESRWGLQSRRSAESAGSTGSTAW